MKKILLLSLSTLFVGISNSQTIVFSSNLENWTNDTLSADFDGTRSSIYPISSTQGVTKVATGGVFGSTVAQLISTSTSHKRLCTILLQLKMV